MPVADLGEQRHQPPYGRDVRVQAGDLRAEVAVQADQVQPGLAQDARDRVRRLAARHRNPELLALHPGPYGRVRARLDARHDADQHPLAAARGHQGGEPGDLPGAVDDDPADAQPQGGTQVGGALGVAVQDEPAGREPRVGGQFQLARGTDVEGQPLLLDPADHGPGEERLARVGDLGVRQRRPPGAGPLAYLLFVDDVGGGAEAVGEMGERDAADGEVARRQGARRLGPRGRRGALVRGRRRRRGYGCE